MILEMKPLSLAEVKDLAGDLDEKKELKDYIKKFGNLDLKKSQELADTLRGLNNMKLKEEFIVKIVDLLPQDSESLNKIFTEVSLDDKEVEEILAIVKN